MLVRYRFLTARPDHGEALLTAILTTFPYHEKDRGELMAQTIELGEAEYRPYAEMVVEQAVETGSTVLCVNPNTKEIDGFLIGWDYLSTPNYLEYPIHPRMKPIIALLEELDGMSVRRSSLARGYLFHQYMMGIRPKARGTGLGRLLLQHSSELACGQGFSKVIAECTGPGSQKLAQSTGMKQIAAISYLDFEYEGRRIFSPIGEGVCCQLMERTLDL